ncbi:MAG: hypothetical protein Q8J64_10270 [Thermodesulfovibrionales bacterium]|nr:hypothetical protein [Thermodesulfovibrionales bacterium]
MSLPFVEVGRTLVTISLAVATLSEKKEFLSLMVDSISIQPKGKKAEIKLSSKYLEMKKLSTGKDTESFLLDGRGDTHQSSGIITPAIITVNLNGWKPRCTKVPGEFPLRMPAVQPVCEAVPI